MADRYPVIAGTWDGSSGAIWAGVKDGVAGSVAAPTANDNVIFDFSGAGFAVTVGNGAVCKDFTMVAPGSGNWTLAGSGSWSVFGSFAFYAGLIKTYVGSITFASTSIGKTITTAGITFFVTLIFNGLGGEWTLLDDMLGVAGITHTAGSWIHGNKNASCTSYNVSGSAVRALTLGSGTFTIATASAFMLNMSGTNFTFNPGTSNFVCNSTNAQASVNFGSVSFYNLTLANPSGYNGFIVSGNPTVTNTLTKTGANANTARLYVVGLTAGTPNVFTCTGTVVLTNVDFEDITGAGGAAGWGTGTSIGDCGGNSGITFTTPRTLHWVNDTGSLVEATTHYSLIAGGTAGEPAPLPQDTVLFDASSFSAAAKTVTNNVAGYRICTLNWANATNAPTFTTANALNFYGSYTLSAGVLLSGAGALTFKGRGLFSIFCAAHTLISNVIVQCKNGTLSLGDDFATTLDFTETLGTFTTNGFGHTCAHFLFTLNGLAMTANLGASLITLTGSGNVWLNQSTLQVVNPGTSVIKFTDATATAKTFTGNGGTYGTLWFSGAGTGNFIIVGSNTFALLKGDTPPHTLLFTAGTTTTFADWQISGTAGNLWVIGSVTTSNHTLRYTGQAPIVADYLNISRSTTGFYRMFAGTHSNNGGNNVGWIFGLPGANKPHLSVVS